ncbi:response regulator [Marinobacterium jannaschii]|uniref:response regulator n=1 Tax=Marinobacterium jannaschii TaxID=64970 RepID=UPI00048869C8|nr:response regulator [Marinobacterium jannaschii]
MAAPRVLIVDDARFIREHVTKIVTTAVQGAEVHAAEDGEAGRKLLTQNRYDIILCDWEMPGMSGLELLQWTRQQPAYQKTPYLMVTSRGERDFVLKAVQAGVNDYIGKPFEAQQLVEKINKWLEKGGETDSTARRRAAQMLAKEPDAAKKTAKKPKGLAQLRIGSASYKCAVKDLTLQQVEVAIKRESSLPVILEQAVVDIEQVGGSSVARMNGFIRSIEAHEPRPDCNFLNIKVYFADNDPEKLEHLSRYIEKMRAR